MSRRLAALTLALYPLAFRRRYGDEMRALLTETPAGAPTVVDMLRGALLAHVRPAAGLADTVDAEDRLRASASGVLACWVAFAAAGIGFAVTTEDSPFRGAAHRHPLLGEAHVAIQALAVVASLVVLIGALPLVLSALAQARRRRGLRMLVSVPIVAVLAFAGLTALMAWIASSQHAHHATGASRAAFIVWMLAGLACGAVCVIYSRRVLFAVPVARRRLVGAYACGALITATMLTMAFATALYALALAIDASRLAGTPNGPFAAPNVSVSLALQLVVMLLASTLAAIATRRGWRAARLAVPG
jgi:hypothetical protein